MDGNLEIDGTSVPSVHGLWVLKFLFLVQNLNFTLIDIKLVETFP